MNPVPTQAQAWIDRHLNELRHIQQMNPTVGALALRELTEDYFDLFQRILIDDLVSLYPQAN
jgi:hypothetical protein